MNNYLFFIKTSSKPSDKSKYAASGKFIYPYAVVRASGIKNAYDLLCKNYGRQELIYIDCFKPDKKKEDVAVYETAITEYFIRSIKVHFLRFNKIVKEIWKEIDQDPKLLDYRTDTSTGKDADKELSSHAKTQESLSKLLFELADAETSLSEINHKLNALNMHITNNPGISKHSKILQELKMEHDKIQSDFSRLNNRINELLSVKNLQIKCLTNKLMQNKMDELLTNNKQQCEIMHQSSHEAAKGDVLEFALVWLAIMQVYGIFSDMIDSYFLSKGFNLMSTKIFIAILFLWITSILIKIGQIFVKKKQSEMKEERYI